MRSKDSCPVWEGGYWKRGRKTTSPAPYLHDNLAFRSELLVNRKHTRFGQARFAEAICQAVQSLSAFRETETARIRRLQHTELYPEQADSLILRAYERKLISHHF